MVMSHLYVTGQVVIYKNHCHSGTTAFVYNEITNNTLQCFDKTNINNKTIDSLTFYNIVSRAKKRIIVQQKYGRIDLAGEYILDGKTHLFIVLLPDRIIDFTGRKSFILRKEDREVLSDWCLKFQEKI